MDCSTPGFPVPHYLSEFAQTYVHWVGDAIQPSHPLLTHFSSCPPSFPASGSFHVNQFCASGGQSIGTSASALFLIINIQGWFPLGLTGRIFLLSKGLSRIFSVQFSSVKLSCVWLFVTPWTAACQASLSNTNSRSLLKLMSIESVMPSNHLIPCCPLLLLPSIFPSIRVFSKESVLHIRWPTYWSFSFFSIKDWFPLGLTGLISL